jgi:hypothetical protein
MSWPKTCARRMEPARTVPERLLRRQRPRRQSHGARNPAFGWASCRRSATIKPCRCWRPGQRRKAHLHRAIRRTRPGARRHARWLCPRGRARRDGGHGRWRGGGRTALQGLHAKAFIAERGWDTAITVGSGNATRPALLTGSNVEIFTTLTGKRSRVGSVEEILGDKGFGRLTRPFVRDETRRRRCRATSRRGAFGPGPARDLPQRPQAPLRARRARRRWRRRSGGSG